MTEDPEISGSPPDAAGKSLSNKIKDKKSRTLKPLTKIIIRRLPPSMTEESFLEQVSPIPEHDYFYFAKPDLSLGQNFYSRAYINFVNVEDIYLFRDKFDGYIFLDSKGIEYVGIVEYAPFQRIPKKKKKKDPKCGTLESDPVYQEFVESLTKEPEPDSHPKLEYSYPIGDGNDKKSQSTPLLEYLAARKQDKRGRDERRRRENDKRKMRIERKFKDPIKEDDAENEVKKIKPRDWDKTKSSKKDEFEESRSYKDRKVNSDADLKKKTDADEDSNDGDNSPKKEVREQKSKKYSDTRKERAFKIDGKSERIALTKIDGKPKVNNHDDIKPFTQLPQVKTDDLSKIIDEMDKKMKLQDLKPTSSSDTILRSNSFGSNDSRREEFSFKRQKSLDDGSTDREDSEEKEKSESTDRRTERRIRNKDRPSLVIYQPGMGRFSKQRLAKDKEPSKLSDTERKDT